MNDELLRELAEQFTTGPFRPTWESLLTYDCPQWFRDAKFGVWAHWGAQAVPEAGDWYARNMYIEGHDSYQYHCEHYGHPSQVGYKDIVKRWHAEHWNPDELMAKYKRAGAKYFVALAVHHDNFDCWNSKHHQWNSVQVGPHQDIVGKWRQAALREGLRFGVTEHLERSYSWFSTNKNTDASGPYAGIPYDGNLKEYEDFYFESHGDHNLGYPIEPPEWWVRHWYLRIRDLVTQHQPDLLYTDGGVPFGPVGLAMVANFYNYNVAANGSLQAIYTLKNMMHLPNHGEFRDGIGIQDLERGVVDDIRQHPWQTDTCIGGWFYNRRIAYKSAKTVVHMLIDIVSKNGNLLLNFPLRPDGTLDSESNSVLDGIAEWMNRSGESIYGTRPWTRFGEGSTRASSGHFHEADVPYTASDFRFTRKDDVLYAFAMNSPEDGKLEILSLGRQGQIPTIESVEIVGSGTRVDWKQSADRLTVHVPTERPPLGIWVLRIRGIRG